MLTPAPLPLRLQLLEVCPAAAYLPPDEAPLLRVAVDARTTLQALRTALIDHPDWPPGLDLEARREAVTTLLNGLAVRRPDERPFARLHPPQAPGSVDETLGVTVAPLPDYSGRWAVIALGTTVDSLWGSRGEALCQAWEVAAQLYPELGVLPPPACAHYALSLPPPPDVTVEAGVLCDGWTWRTASAGEAGFATALAACVAAWTHLRAVPPAWEAGDVDPCPDGDGTWEAGIHHCRAQWGHRVVVYGDSRDEAATLRDRVLAALLASEVAADHEAAA